MKSFILASLLFLGASPCLATWSCGAACANDGWNFTYVTGMGVTAVDAFKNLVAACPTKLVKSGVVLKLGSDSAGYTLSPAWSPVTLVDACVKE